MIKFTLSTAAQSLSATRIRLLLSYSTSASTKPPTVSTPPNVYGAITKELLEGDKTNNGTSVSSEEAGRQPQPPLQMLEDQAEAIKVARQEMRKNTALIIPEFSEELNEEQEEYRDADEIGSGGNGKWGVGFYKRLVADGGEKILKMSHNYIHVEYTRFIEPCGEIKGLSIDQALLQLAWNKKQISLKVREALDECIVRAKDEGFDLKNTYIADAYVKESSHGLSKLFMKQYVRGRGRYGATPHPKVAKLELVLQDRSAVGGRGFAKRTQGDPLEWVRTRLRNQKIGIVKLAEAVYSEKRSERSVKAVYY